MPYNSLVSRTDAAAMVPEEVSNAMLGNLEQQSAMMALGTKIPLARNQTRFPVLSALPVAYFVSGDTGLKQTTEAAWANKFLYVEEIACIVPVPESVLDDASFDIWGSLRPLMETAISRTLDAAIVFGTSAPATWIAEGNLVGKAVAAGNLVARGTNAAAAGAIHGDLSDVVGKLEVDGYAANGAIGNITLRGRLRQVRDTTGQQMQLAEDIPTPIYNLGGLWPTGASAAEYLVGDFTQLVVGIRQDMTYKVLTEGVITDAGGLIIYNLPQQDMIALRLVFRAGYAVANPINFQEPVEANRSPFAVLRSP